MNCKKILAFFLSLILIVSVLPLGALTASAVTEVSGPYTYYITWYDSQTVASITDVDSTLSGDITIPSELGGCPVALIESGAFDDCSQITGITFPTTFKYARCGFADCTSLTKINITDLTAWCNAGFYSYPYNANTGLYLNGELITDLVIPEGVTKINSGIFNGCKTIESVIIPEGVTEIGSAFSNCSNLKSITIPSTVTEIDYNCFYRCYALENVYLSDIEAWCNIDLGNSDSPFADSKAENKSIYLNGTLLENVVIPDSVTLINGFPFSFCTSIKSVDTGDGITKIEYGTFENCTNLETVVLGNSVTELESCFGECSSLKNLTFSSSVKKISSHWTFSDCDALENVYISDLSAWCNIEFGGDYANPLCYADNLYLNNELVTDLTVPESVTKISDYAFIFYDKLESVTIGDSIESIGENAFRSCYNLKEITLGSNVASIGGGAFCDDENLENVYVSDLKAWCNIEFASYESNPLYYANKLYLNGELLTDAVIPQGAENVPQYAFSCENITSVIIPDSVTAIESRAFYNAASLKNAVIGDGVKNIGEYAFADCAALESVTLGNSVETLGDSVFEDCYELRDVVIPASLKTVGGSVFSWCDKLENVYISDIAAWCNIECSDENWYTPPLQVADNLYLNGELVTDIVIPSGVTTIPDYAFSCKSLTSITIPDTVTSIGRYAFEESSLTSVVIPDSVKIIDYGAFRNCSVLENVTLSKNITEIPNSLFGWCRSLKNITLPDGITTIGDSAFYDCNSLESINIPSSVTVIGSEAFNLGYDSKIKNVYIKDIESWCNTVFVNTYSNPLYYADNLYVNNKLVTEIVIPESITEIPKYAFSCNHLEKITIPESVTSIGVGAFYDCEKLSVVNIPESVTVIEDETFYGCSNLKNIDIHDNITTIGKRAFKESGLEKVQIPATVENLGNSAFESCDKIVNITVPSSVEAVGEYVFEHCENLESAYISDDIAKLDYMSFYYCRNLKNVRLPSEITEIGYGAFERCENLTDVWYAGSEEDRNNISFDSGNYYLMYATWHYNTCKDDEHEMSDGCISKCLKCDWTVTEHNYKTATTKATTSKDGKIEVKCSICQDVKSSEVIEKISSVELSATSYTYNGAVKTPTVTVTDSNGVILTKDTDYTVTYAGGRKNAGTYKVTVTFKGNYTGTKELSFKINPRTTANCTYKLSTTSYTYNGAVKTPTVTVKTTSGTTLKKDTHYTVTYATGRKNAGTYKVTVKMKGNYSGTKTLTFKINPRTTANCTYKLSTTSYTYNGAVKTPTVTVKTTAGTKLTKGTHYTVTYATGRKNVGTYKVTVKMKGNYTGTKTLTFKINPPKTTVSSLTAGKKSLKVYITKKSTQVTGYQIQYSTSKSFKSYKTKNISSYKTTSTTLSGLTAKKTYYVRVRTYKTVGGVKYYSGWSTYKYKKTK